MLRRALVAIVLFEIAFIAAAGTGAWSHTAARPGSGRAKRCHVLHGPATKLLKRGVSERIYPLPGGKSVADFITLAEDNGVRIIGCAQSLDLVGMTVKDLAQQLPMLTPGQALPALALAKRILTW